MALVTQQVVPHRFGAGLRDREWHAGQGVLQAHATVGGFGVDGILGRVLQLLLGEIDRALGRIDVDAVGREALEQLLGARSELVAMGCGVLGRDDQARFVAGVRIWTHAAALDEGGRDGRQAAGVFRNGAVLVAGLFGADRSQGRAQLPGFVRRYGGVRAGGNQCGCQ